MSEEDLMLVGELLLMELLVRELLLREVMFPELIKVMDWSFVHYCMAKFK